MVTRSQLHVALLVFCLCTNRCDRWSMLWGPFHYPHLQIENFFQLYKNGYINMWNLKEYLRTEGKNFTMWKFFQIWLKYMVCCWFFFLISEVYIESKSQRKQQYSLSSVYWKSPYVGACGCRDHSSEQGWVLACTELPSSAPVSAVLFLADGILLKMHV